MAELQKSKSNLIIKITRNISIAFIIFLLILGSGLIITKGKYTINVSPSLPRGIYLLYLPQKIVKGDIVLLTVPQDVKEIMIERKYITENMDLLKRIVATEGDIIQIKNDEIYINGIKKPFSKIKKYDSQNNILLSTLKNCKIEKDFFLVMGDTSDSYDSRYFGIIHKSLIKRIAKKI